jgi:hypothetical protein
MGTMLREMLAPKGSHGNDRSDALLVMTGDEALLIGILPDWESGTRGAPGSHDLRVRLRLGPNPFEEIEDQGADGI